MKQRTILSLILPLFFAAACTKESMVKPENGQSCASVWLISDKYTKDTVWLRVDTLWHDANICGADLQKCKNQEEQWILFCTPPIAELPLFILEKRTYFFNHKN